MAEKITGRGSCHCGNVVFETTVPLTGILNCHCKDCQKLRGMYSAFVIVPKEHFHVREEKTLKWYKASEKSERGFCTECGSQLFMHLTDSPRMLISAGVFDAPLQLKPFKDIFTESAGDYYEVPHIGE